MTQPIKVSFAALSAASTDITGSSTTISSRLDQLEGDLAPMVASWEGQAALFYREKQMQWDTAAAELAEVLRQIGTAVRTAGENYAQTEQQVGSSWQ